MSNTFDIFFANIWVVIRTNTTNVAKYSIEKIPIDEVMMKNQNDNPAVIARDLNRGDDASILNRIDKCH